MSVSPMTVLLCGVERGRWGILFDGILECKYCLYSLISIQFVGGRLWLKYLRVGLAETV